MTAKTSGSKPTSLLGPRQAHRYQKGVKSGEKIYNGALTSLDAVSGLWAGAVSTDPTQIVYGWADLCDVDSFDNTAGTATTEMLVESGCKVITFASILITDEGKICYVADDQTGTLTPGGPVMGIVQQYIDATHAYVSVDPIVNKALSLTSAGAGPAAFKARAVMTSLAANTVTSGVMTMDATGAFATQDGLTLALGDVVFIQEGTTNLDNAQEAGPWQVTTLGATGVAGVLSRPSWWAHGGPIPQGIVIEIGGEGTGTNPNLAGTSWKTFCGKSRVIGTDAPVFWPRKTSCAVTLASGTLAAARTTMPVRALLSTDITITSNPTTAPHASTRDWRVSAVTAGVTGTASVQIVAESAPGTTNTSDVGQYNIAVINW